MNKKLLQKIAVLETKLDMLETEFFYLDKILKKCGFPEGIKTLKETVDSIVDK
jgi:hypothetical protein